MPAHPRSTPDDRHVVAVVGGGIAGLAAAWRLATAPDGPRVVLLEASPRVGGKLEVGAVDGLVVDLGAESMLARRPEATALAACVPGNSLAAVYHALFHAYRHAGRPDAMREHPQGGVTGYQARELVATPSTAHALEPGMALAFNPGFAGIQIEDTFLLGEHGLENLTFDPAWPSATVQGRSRPLWLEAAC